MPQTLVSRPNGPNLDALTGCVFPDRHGTPCREQPDDRLRLPVCAYHAVEVYRAVAALVR